jgi:hypothetical protein
MTDKQESIIHCIECGEECDGSFKDQFGEPLRAQCADELGYTDGQPE